MTRNALAIAVLIALSLISPSLDGQSVSQPTSAPVRYLCVADQSAGMAFRNNSWQATVFKTDDKFIVAASSRPGVAFDVTRVGENFASYRCSAAFDQYDYLDCDGVGQFRMNRKNNRFISTYVIGYLPVGIAPDITDRTSDTPSMNLGKCSPF